MPTPVDPTDYVELDSTTGPTILLGSRGLFWAGDDEDELLMFGDAKGGNWDVPGANGEVAMPSTRAAMDVELGDVVIDGSWTEDNVRVTGCTKAQWRVNSWQRLRGLISFVEDDCVGRLCTVRRHLGGATYTATNVKVLGIDSITQHVGYVLTFDITLRVPTGILVASP